MEQFQEDLNLLLKKMWDMKTSLNFHEKIEELNDLAVKTTASAFWSDEDNAKQVMRRIADLKDLIEPIQGLEKRIRDLLGLCESASEEEGNVLDEDIKKELQEIRNALAILEIRVFLSGPHDSNDAIVAIHAGQGGTEAMDWAAMLLRMYTRYVERKGWKWEQVAETPGEAGIKSATILVNGHLAYGLLKGERGVHRLVRQSPFNADQLRQTSFALVEVLPQIEEPKEVQLKDEDIVFEAFRAAGHGGQNVNKVSTAVRLKHIPTGLIIESQSQRYQEQNRKIALKILTAKLWESQHREFEEKMKQIKGEHKLAGWGNQIRSYVLHPYHMVKDLRTGVETQDTASVLDGDLDGFIENQVRWAGTLTDER